MIVSHNELVAAVNKAFLGMKRSCGEADVIANMVADLQMVGLNGIRHFNNACNYLGLEQDCAVQINKVEPGLLEVDLHQNSVACHLPVILDFALESMVGQKQLKMTLLNCHNRWLAYSELVKLAAKGIACRAYWSNGSQPKRTLYVLNRGCVAPELYFSDTDLVEDDLHSMTIELSIEDFNQTALAGQYNTHIDSTELSRSQQAAWVEGIFVDDTEWAMLKQTATIFLVENSQRSLQGAGELVE
ncbi:DUF3726 domain-containing protein [Vibrio mediterranei]|uniref:DUF3726 domain-containing protein n=1 Tax=Vibrio mediterranei TaxID=689 RepID=A0AAN1FHS6_9VIBR|nr:DUF3726 domain-containing protein [Vibrio mediterranei]ASI90532.1 hypothetical protein BSZ05_12505 [Vibrio mediterranei]